MEIAIWDDKFKFFVAHDDDWKNEKLRSLSLMRFDVEVEWIFAFAQPNMSSLLEFSSVCDV